MRRTLITVSLVAPLLTSCLLETGKEVPLVTGQGAVVVDAKTQEVKLDTAKVPVLPACAAGQVVRRNASGDGWECAAYPLVSEHQALQNKVNQLESQLGSHTHPPGDITGFDSAVAGAMDGATVPSMSVGPFAIGSDREAGTDVLTIGHSGDASSHTLVLTADGNVGLGTTTPGVRLDVVGPEAGGADIRTNNYLYVAAWPNYGTGQIGMWYDGAGGLDGHPMESLWMAGNVFVKGMLRMRYSSSTVQALAANGINTITHNLNIASPNGQQIWVINGDYAANAYTVGGVAISSTTVNSFVVYTTGGTAAGNARFDWMILAR